MGTRLVLSYRLDDTGMQAAILKVRLRGLYGPTSFVDLRERLPGVAWTDHLEAAVASGDAVVVLIGPRWMLADVNGRRWLDDPTDPVHHEIATALARGKRVVPVLVGGAAMPRAEDLPADLAPLARRQAIEFDPQRPAAGLERLFDEPTAAAAPPVLAPTTGSVPPPPPRAPAEAPAVLYRKRTGLAEIAVGAVADALRAAAGRLAGVLLPRSEPRRSERGPVVYDAPPLEPAPAGAAPPEAAGAAPREPVLLGVTAPKQTRPGARFNAVLAAYAESARPAAEKQLQRLGGEASEPLLDLPPDLQAGWVIGAPVTVTLTATNADVEPAQRRFEWNGRLNLAAFVVTVHAEAQEASVDLEFHVALGGVPIAFVPLPVALAAAPAAAEQRIEQIRTAGSAFASYSSKDAQTVGFCLSALTRWSPGLAIRQDCLDLTPNEAFKPQLAEQIAASDVFLLFWSRHASASPWVQWEFETACERKGLSAIVPMPLEDPKIAPPPPVFEQVHLRDRFMVARYALAQIDQIAAGQGRESTGAIVVPP